MTTRLKKTEVVIIGLGAAGGYSALSLAKAGVKVTALEAGPRWKPEDFPMDELRNDVRAYLSQPKYMKEIPTFRYNSSQVALQGGGPEGMVVPMVNGVGGTSLHYGKEQWRYLPHDFEVRSHTIKRYGASRIPAGSTLVDWPISYDDLEPYYDKVEYDMGVSGEAGNIKGKLIPGGNPFEGPRQRGYPLPPLRPTGWTDYMKGVTKRMGLHPFHGPAAVRSEAYITPEGLGVPGCQYCGYCSSNGCMVEASGSTLFTAIPEAEATGNLKVLTGARATKIEVDRQGRATGVTFRRGGQEYFQPADVVVLSSFLYENTRLLLLSTSKAYPNGLSNNHAQVGKNYINHIYVAYAGLYPGMHLNRFTGNGAQRITVDDWTGDNFDHSKLDFIGGGVIDFRMEAKAMAVGRSTPPSVPAWGSQYKEWIRKNGNSVGDGIAQLDTLPYEDNYIDLDPTVKDPEGFPVVRITWGFHPEETARVNFIIDKVVGMHKEGGASETWPYYASTNPININPHAFGTTRMGTDPDTSVVDPWLMSHEVPNLAILGGSVFPNAGGHNPTLTIQALAWRNGDHIAKNWKTIAA